MDQFCGELGFGPIVDDKLTPCARTTLLETALPVFLLLLSSPYLISRIRRSFAGYEAINNETVDKPPPVKLLSAWIQTLHWLNAILTGLWLLLILIDTRPWDLYEGIDAGIQFFTWVCLAVLSLYVFPNQLSPNEYTRAPFDLICLVFAISNACEAYLQTESNNLDLRILLHGSVSITAGLLIVLGRIFGYKLEGARRVYYTSLPTEHGSIKPSLEMSARWFEIPTFGWVNPLLNLGLTKTITQDDIPDLSPEDKAENVDERFKQLRNPKHGLFYDLFRLAWRNLKVQMFFGFICTPFLSFANPFFLNLIVGYIQSGYSSIDPVTVYLIVFGFFFFTFFRSAMDGQSFFYGRRVGLQVRTVLLNQVYQKALRRTVGRTGKEGEENASVGKIVTLMSVDAERIRDFICYLHQFAAAPVQIALCLTALCLLLGPSALGGVLVMTLAIPFNILIGIVTNKYQTLLMKKTDTRVDIVNEMLNGIRLIKYLAFEDKFAEKVLDARDAELSQLLRIMAINIFQHLLWACLPLFVSIATFYFYTVIAGHDLDAVTAFSTLALFNVLHFPLMIFPEAIVQGIQVRVSFNRIASFLKEPELERYAVEDDANAEPGTSSGAADQEAIGIDQGDFIWGGSQSEPINGEATSSSPVTPRASTTGQLGSFSLEGIDVKFPIGKLSVIVGATGAGKTSLLQALLGEMDRVTGFIHLPRASVQAAPVDYHGAAYVAGTPWLQCATVRENILFGLPYDSTRYEKVVRACALDRDFEQFDGGDQSEIGERGINLSGGQKARIALARAAYSFAKIVLLDDILSAIDAPTARHLFKETICGLLAGRTVVLVSHALPVVLPSANFVVVMDFGRVVATGTPSQVLSNARAQHILGAEANLIDLDYDDSKEAVMIESAKPKFGAGISQVSLTQLNPPSRLVEEERKDSGAVRWAVYACYLAAAGGLPFVVLWALFSLSQRVDQVMSDWWIRWWSAAYAGGPNLYSVYTALIDSFDSQPRVDVMYYVGIYGLLGLTLILLNVITIIIMYWGSYRASQTLHKQLLSSVLGSPLRFFETTPLGRIVNRFSKDISSLDTDVIFSIFIYALNIIDLISLIGVISVVFPAFLLAVPPISYVYYSIANKYLTCSRELKRIESTSRSPIYSLFSETIGGVATIRAFGHETRFTEESQKRVNIYHRAFFHIWAANRWLAFRIDCVVACVVLPTTLGILAIRPDPGLAGLVLMYALSITDALLWITRNHAWMEMCLNSVERVVDYTTIPQEPSGGDKPPANWPVTGRVLFQNLCVRYSPDSPDVLSNINFEVEPGQRVAIVGRTGSGKTTLSLALFRIVEWRTGRILIDGVDLSKVNIRELRSRMTIIPQDPVLFRGTLRTNLDPFGEHGDETLADALTKCHFLDSMQQSSSSVALSEVAALRTSVTAVKAGVKPSSKAAAGNGVDLKRTASNTSINGSMLSLDSQVLEGGSNLSQGQRQLICLARALLRKSKIVCMDEATSSTDSSTDQKITITIKQAFASSTVFTIAHRLRTIIDYDKVLVLAGGKLVEAGRPLELMQKDGGIFNGMCQQSGDFDELLSAAERSRKR
ncbi:hypothetical protein SmJEL517_g03868 [Synchytrium microbalum]|uniref:P-loop containing nucleoside triphosphate hydrolase protein n=1 Tax=Synchytrium microbalum TaxID=1806994 RepID=A0A507C0N1_9FUNG|nr:uncharacterized protein SmJEL517_g03868 [Synchytrium microbalum]TPX33242.1 hypothetical protein SmJEL517_g03868 [Synchytrium microbalum]